MQTYETGLFDRSEFEQTPIIKLNAAKPSTQAIQLCGSSDYPKLLAQATQSVHLETSTSDWYAPFETVLYQPETKARQTVFLNDLYQPTDQYIFELGHAAPEEWVIDLVRPKSSQAYALQFNVPDGMVGRVVIKTTIDQPNTEPPVKKDRPAVFIRATVGHDASLDIVYLHPLYGEVTGECLLKAKHELLCLYHVDVQTGGQFKWTSVNLGDALIEKGYVDFKGQHAQADLGGAAYVPSGSSQTYQAHVNCAHAYGQVRIHNHGVVEDDGYGHFVSLSNIQKGAHSSVVREDNRFITLGERAKAYADPTLLIDEYDVKASHAATVGQMDEETMFYLRSRGLSLEQAKRLMTIGFLTPLLDRVSQVGLRDELVEVLTDKVNHTHQTGASS